MLKRLLYLPGLFPLFIYCGIAWVITGKNQIPKLDAYEKWCLK